MLKSDVERTVRECLQSWRLQMAAEYEERLSKLEERIVEDRQLISALEQQVQLIYNRVLTLVRRLGDMSQEDICQG